ncbi:MAG: restriction endonuclease subunit S [Sphaerochaeta sp.]|jgi:type I restriction enzyme S subunit|nr:restriction endonuclease subunit S [Sphaerochaeta sp.]
MNKTNTPQIRFKGFTEAWEQRKLLQISDKVTEKNSSREYSETFTNSAEFGIISQREFFDKDISNEENIDGYYIVKNDDFVYNPRISTFAPVGPIKRNKLGRDGVMSPLYYVFRTHDIDPTYLEHFFTTTGWHKFMKLNGDSGARSDRFSIKDSVFREMPLPYPSIDEQKKIGEFFDVITNLITLHQRKCEMLQKTKKALLEKMFPQNGSAFPEVRFKGFTETWEQRKLGDVVDRVIRKNTNLQSSLPLTISAQYGLVDQITYFNNRVASQNVSGYYLIKQGEFAYNKSSSEGFPFGAVKRLDRYEMGVLSTLYIVFALKPNAVNSQFLVSYYDTNNWHKQVSMRAAEGARNHGLLNISTEDFFDTELMIPQDKDEQERIGQMLLNLDTLITLHQRELEKLQKLKSACLQKMFV